MKNSMEFPGGYKAVIAYDPEIAMFRGEFINLKRGGADFYAKDADALKMEGQKSLDVFLQMCAQDGVPPKKPGRTSFPLRLDPDTYEAAATAAVADGMSLNQ